jgi:hypothetical protein
MKLTCNFFFFLFSSLFIFSLSVSGGRIKRELSQRALESGGALRRGRSMLAAPEDTVDALKSNTNDGFDDAVWADIGSLPSSQRTSMTRGGNLLEYNQSNDATFVS